MEWIYKHFAELTGKEMYEILQLRNRVFVVEQNCVYDDTDDKDIHCYHLCGYEDDRLVAYARIVPPRISYDEASIGRVVTHPQYRSFGYGKLLMKTAIEETKQQFNVSSIRISAQEYLLNFYADLGFVSTGKSYLEDGIPHVEMVYVQ